MLALLALACDDNRLAAHKELARLLQQGSPVSPLLTALAAHMPARAEALSGPLPPRALARALLGREEGAALLRQLLLFGVRDPVDGVRGAAWDALGAVLGVSGGEEEEGEEKDGESEEEAMVVRRLPPLLPLLVAARGQADAEEGRGAMTGPEAVTVPLGAPGPRGLLARFVLQMAKAAAAQAAGKGEEEEWALLAPLLDLFSLTSTLRLGARRQLHAMLHQQDGPAEWPKACTLRPEAAFAQDEEADEEAGRTGGWAPRRSAAAAAWAGGPRYASGGGGTAAAAAAAEEAAASPARLGALCDLLLDPGALGEAEQLAAARDLTLLLTMSMSRPASQQGPEGMASTSSCSTLLPPWAAVRVLEAARQLLNRATPVLEEAGAELLLAIAWSGASLAPRILRPFVPFLFHPSPTVRNTTRLALLPALFGRREYWAAASSVALEDEVQGTASAMPFSDRAPEGVLVRVPSASFLEGGQAGDGGSGSSNRHTLTYLLHGPSARDGGGGSTALLLPAFLAGCFLLPSSAAPNGRATPRPLVWLHPLPCVDPARGAAVKAPLLSPLLDALIPLWYSQSLPDAAAGTAGAASPLLSPVPALALHPHGAGARAAALATALQGALSHSALSAALQALTQAVLVAPEVADAFLGLEWTKALGRLLRVRA